MTRRGAGPRARTRSCASTTGGPDDATEDLVAESVAHIVCGYLGPDTCDNAIPYLASWAEDTSGDAFERIAGLVDHLAHRIEDGLDTCGEVTAATAATTMAR